MPAPLTCDLCGRGVKDGVALHRQNSKGVKGIWRCGDCNMLPVDPGVQAVLDALDPAGKSKWEIQ